MVESAIEGLIIEVLHADDLVLMSEMTEGLRGGSFGNGRRSLKAKGLKVNLG